MLRFATELVPATFAVMGPDQISPFWAVLFYFTLIMFGIAQQLAIWHCIITGLIAIRTKVLKYWETTITFFSCACGFIIGLPMATEVSLLTPLSLIDKHQLYLYYMTKMLTVRCRRLTECIPATADRVGCFADVH